MKTELSDRVRVEVGEARLARGWERIEARAFAPPRRWQGPRLALSFGALTAIAALVALAFFGGRGGSLALRAEGGAPGELLRAAGGAGGAVRFDDGSRIVLSPSTELEPIANTGSRFRVLLHEGRARFEVEPGGPRRWVVEAGHATVEVIGTVFTVERSAESTRVEVERGRVMVRSDRLPEGVVVLGAGDVVDVRALGASLPASGVVPIEPSEASTHEHAPAEHAGAARTPQTRGLAGADGTEGPAARPSSPAGETEAPQAFAMQETAATLLVRADEARAAGDSARALDLLGRASERTTEREAALASLTRARLLLTLRRPDEAVTDLRRALAAGLPLTLEESARYRLVGALAAAGDRAGSAGAAQDYLRRYPEGSFRDEVLAQHSDRAAEP